MPHSSPEASDIGFLSFFVSQIYLKGTFLLYKFTTEKVILSLEVEHEKNFYLSTFPIAFDLYYSQPQFVISKT